MRYVATVTLHLTLGPVEDIEVEVNLTGDDEEQTCDDPRAALAQIKHDLADDPELLASLPPDAACIEAIKEAASEHFVPIYNREDPPGRDWECAREERLCGGDA